MRESTLETAQLQILATERVPLVTTLVWTLLLLVELVAAYYVAHVYAHLI